MNCNGIYVIPIVMFLIMMMNIEILVLCQQFKKLQKNTISKDFLFNEGTNGDLYDIFQKRLQAIQNELSYHKLEDLNQQSTKAKRRFLNKSGKTETLNNENVTRFPVQEQLHGKYKNKMDRINKELSRGGKKYFDRSGRSFFGSFESESKDTNLKDKKFEYLNDNIYKITNKENEEKENFEKIDDTCLNPKYLNFNTTRDKLYQEFQKQLKLINSFATSKEKRDYCWAAPYLNKNHNYYDENWLQDSGNYNNLDRDYENRNNDYELWNLLPQNASYSNVHRRQVITNHTSLYPSVLTKAVEISLNPNAHIDSGGSFLAHVAQKMNTSTLELAEKLAKSTDNLQNNGQLTQMVQNLMTNNGDSISANTSKSVSSQIISATNGTTNGLRPIIVQKFPISSPVEMGSTEVLQKYTDNEESPNGITISSLTAILDRVLSKLDSIHDDKNKNEEDHPDGAPCDITGSWSSLTLGLCFDIQLYKDKVRDFSPAEVNNKILSINAQECIPPKSHEIIDLEWKFGGSAFKQLGGPFYIYTQKRSESLVGTFLGYCRTSAGIDTIFGSWTFLSPSKDCQDISLAFNGKRDLLRRVRMEIKRKERFKDLLYQTRVGKTKIY